MSEAELKEAMKRNPHLRRYIENFKRTYMRIPDFMVSLSRELKELKYPNIIYPVGDPIFIHIFGTPETKTKYIVIEPTLETAEEKLKYKMILNKILELAPYEETPKSVEEFEEVLTRLFNACTKVTEAVGEEGFFKEYLGLQTIKLKSHQRREINSFTY